MKVEVVTGVMEQIHSWAKRAKKKEVVGWLVGYWDGGGLIVLDAVLSKDSSENHLTGAKGSPNEESELSLSLPRGVGIVGLFHSHPFTKGRKALFHSTVDDLTLGERSRRGKYVSFVTEGEQTRGFYFENGQRSEEVVEIGESGVVQPEFYSGRIVISESCQVEELEGARTALKEIEEYIEKCPLI